MTENKPSTDPEWVDEDDAPDLSTPEYQRKFAAVAVKRGRPKLASAKTSVTIRLDADVVERLRASGFGWQSRVNETLRGSIYGFVDKLRAPDSLVRGRKEKKLRPNEKLESNS